MDYLNKYYSNERYSKYYEDENERKILRSLSNKNCNNYLSQTKSTSMKCKPKVFYIKNDYSYMKKNSLPYKIELSRSSKKKNFDEINTINEKKDENENEIEKSDYQHSHQNKFILPIINKNYYQQSSNSNFDKKIMINHGRNKKPFMSQRDDVDAIHKHNINFFSKDNINDIINNSDNLNNNNYISTPRYIHNSNLKNLFKPNDNESINKSSSSFKNLVFLNNKKHKIKIKNWNI